jgi:phosphoglycerol transferase MdoB-like AlkP superfamily enzyme
MNAKIKLAVIWLGWLMMLYFIARLCFYFFYFNGIISGNDIWKVFYWGARMDFFILFFLNLPFLMLYFFGRRYFPGIIFNLTGYFFCLLPNMLMLALNITDIAYFKYTHRRSNIDIVYVTGDSLPAMSSFLKQYWPLLLLFIVLVILSYRVFRKYILETRVQTTVAKSGKAVFTSFCFLLLLTFMAMGSGMKPLLPSTPLLYLKPEFRPLAINSTVTFIYSIFRKQTRLPNPGYFKASTIDSLASVRKEYAQQFGFSKRNVVIFILESFSAELIDRNSTSKAQTPFLDSLMGKSIYCKNAFANGLESNKGIVALLGSIPPLMDEPYYYSPYSDNRFNGIGTILHQQDYSTFFFMGASPDHFGFGKWCRMLGIDNYYSEKEYGHAEHHDGNWGIYDHYFFPYAAGILRSAHSPFLAVMYNISSHPPFSIPPELKRQFTIPGQTAQQNSITYVDYSLRRFFDTIRNEPWYDSTLFVFSADHAITLDGGRRSDLYNLFRIPIFFHIPANHNGATISKVVQQLDVVPSILDMLHYNKPFMSFGQSIFREKEGFTVNKVFDSFQYIDSSFLMGYNQGLDSVLYFYNYKNDPGLSGNLSHQEQTDEGIRQRRRQLQAFIQQFDERMTKNRLFIR